jgi:3-carboxy-cis,cis-muconate cycloisomerase
MAAIFSAHSQVQSLLDFEAALARAEAEVGVIPVGAAETIVSHCHADRFDFDALAQGAALSGNLAIPLLKALTEQVAREAPEAARWLHWGATSQDVLDTGLVLQLRRALDSFEADLARLSLALAALVQTHRHSLLLGRTWLQPGPPVTFGLKAAGWLSALERQRSRLSELRARVLVLQFGGAVGTLAALGEQAMPVAIRLGAQLDLPVPDLPWHAQRDRIAEVAAGLGLLTGSLGKMARDLSLLMQVEVAEAFEPGAPGRGGSSTMPHTRNPVGAAAILSAAIRVPALVATLLAALPQEHERGLGGWQAEWETLPEICRLSAGALRHSIHIFEGLEVNVARMRQNLDKTLGTVLAEPVALALAQHMGRSAAHGLVARACQRATEQDKPLAEVLSEEPEVTARLPPAELERLCDPANYLGLTDAWIDRVLAAATGAGKRGRP